LPYPDIAPALDLIQQTLPDIPFWPQLPRRSFLESMYVQYSEGMVGVQVDATAGQIIVDTRSDHSAAVEAFYATYLSESLEPFAISPDYSAGFPAFVQQAQRWSGAICLKGHITGPISFGLKVTDQDLRPSLYDDTLRDVIIKTLARKAQWQERELRRLHPHTLIFVDEPYLASFGSSLIKLNEDEVIAYLDEVFAGISGIKGVHCCGNTDWGLITRTQAQVLSFDAYNYAVEFSLYAPALEAFLRRGGIIAWGIVPTTAEDVDREDLPSLLNRLNEAMERLAAKGIPGDRIRRQALITTACGLGPSPVETAVRALQLTRDLSGAMRQKFRLGGAGRRARRHAG